MKQILIFLLFFAFFTNLNAQSTKSLSQQLWDEVQPCYSNFEDMDDDGKVDFDELIDDSKNGYLKISGSWPTCGCACNSTVGAFKDKSGKYTFVKKETYNCSWSFAVSANRDLKTVLPDDILSAGFFSNPISNFGEYAIFFLDIEIPQYGTDTKVSIELIPFGLLKKSNSVMAYSFSEEDDVIRVFPLYRLAELVEDVSDNKTIDYILNNQFEKINATDKKLIAGLIGDDMSQFKSETELAKHLKSMKKMYEIYQQINHQTLTLGWDKEKGKFYIKEKGSKPKEATFKEFITKNGFWGPVC